MGQVYFYRCDDDERELHKTLQEITVAENAIIKEDSTVMDLNLIWDYSVLGYPDWVLINYAWVEDTQRYYFVGNTQILQGTRVLFPLHCDVLYTANASEARNIDNLSCLIERQESLYNSYYVDNNMPILSSRVTERCQIGVVGDGSGRCYAINVLNNRVNM